MQVVADDAGDVAVEVRLEGSDAAMQVSSDVNRSKLKKAENKEYTGGWVIWRLIIGRSEAVETGETGEGDEAKQSL